MEPRVRDAKRSIENDIVNGNDRERDAAAENARVGYQVAVTLATYSGGGVWSIFNAMVVANSVIIAGITLFLTNQPGLRTLVALLSVVGPGPSITWLLLVKRAHQYVECYILSAREIEKTHLAPDVRTLSRGAAFSRGETVVIGPDHSSASLRMPTYAWLRGQYVSYVGILLLTAVYVVLLYHL